MPAQSSTLHAQWAPAAASLKVGSADAVYYTNLHEALAAAAAETGTGTKTVTLLSNIGSETEGYYNALEVVSGLTVTLDLNGKIIDLTNISGHTISVYGNMTLIDSGSDTAHSGGLPNGGLIRNGRCGVGIQSGGSFTMKGGTISENYAGYGVYNEGKFMMDGGTISGNALTGVDNHNTFTMTGGTISGNAWLGVDNFDTFTMTGGTVSGNTESGVYNGKTFTMTGGTISGNTESGVYNSKTFTMTGGTISGNTESGVYNSNTFTMTGGMISGNQSYGVYVVEDDQYIYLSGAAQIKENNTGNVYLSSGSYIRVTGALTSDGKKASVGVTLANGTGVFTSGFTGYGSSGPADGPRQPWAIRSPMTGTAPRAGMSRWTTLFIPPVIRSRSSAAGIW